MKSKLFVILIFVASICFGQSVPNTTTFTLQDVVDAVNPTTDDLVDCFSDAIPSYFNPTYEGSKDNLLNFRDYGPHNGCPAYASSGSLAYLTNTNSLTVSYPAVNAGDFVIIAAAHYSTSTMAISGWTQLSSSAFIDYTYAVFYKHFTSDDAGGTVNVTSSNSVTKFAVAHRISANSGNSISLIGSSINFRTNTYTTPTTNGNDCNLGITVAGLFISQSLGISPGTGWTTRFNDYQSGIGAAGLVTYDFTSTTTAPGNTFTFTGLVPFAHVTALIY